MGGTKENLNENTRYKEIREVLRQKKQIGTKYVPTQKDKARPITLIGRPQGKKYEINVKNNYKSKKRKKENTKIRKYENTKIRRKSKTRTSIWSMQNTRGTNTRGQSPRKTKPSLGQRSKREIIIDTQGRQLAEDEKQRGKNR